jgi:ArsR family transcriptional regulator, arsenate/arsenite/antimonite-responsive transcriptional repressor
MMDDSQAISAFSALAQDTRLGFLRVLIKAGEQGLASGALAEKLGVSAASSSFHLGHLEQAGLVVSKRASRSIIYCANYEKLGALIQFLLEDCCGNDPRITDCC